MSKTCSTANFVPLTLWGGQFRANFVPVTARGNRFRANFVPVTLRGGSISCELCSPESPRFVPLCSGLFRCRGPEGLKKRTLFQFVRVCSGVCCRAFGLAFAACLAFVFCVCRLLIVLLFACDCACCLPSLLLMVLRSPRVCFCTSLLFLFVCCCCFCATLVDAFVLH